MIVMEIDTYLNTKSEYGEKIDRLNESQKILLIVENFIKNKSLQLTSIYFVGDET